MLAHALFQICLTIPDDLVLASLCCRLRLELVKRGMQASVQGHLHCASGRKCVNKAVATVQANVFA